MNGMKLNNVRTKLELGGFHYSFKSKAEARFAAYLDWLLGLGELSSWSYEPREFWFPGIKRGAVSYKPDFLAVDRSGVATWYEVKGYMDARSKTKLKRFSKHFPDEKLIVIDSAWFKRNSKKLKGLVPNWV